MTCVLDRLQLAWWESGNCHVMHEWTLGGDGADDRSAISTRFVNGDDAPGRQVAP